MENHSEKKIIFANSKYRNMNGITCWLNSILSILQQTPLFADYFLNGHFSNRLLSNIHKIILKDFEDNNIDDDINDPENMDYLISEYLVNKLSYQLYQLFKASLTHDNCSITPTSFKRTLGKINPMWNEFNHQDSPIEKEGKVSIKTKPKKSKTDTNDMGDYVDFEEVDD